MAVLHRVPFTKTPLVLLRSSSSGVPPTDQRISAWRREMDALGRAPAQAGIAPQRRRPGLKASQRPFIGGEDPADGRAWSWPPARPLQHRIGNSRVPSGPHPRSEVTTVGRNVQTVRDKPGDSFVPTNQIWSTAGRVERGAHHQRRSGDQSSRGGQRRFVRPSGGRSDGAPRASRIRYQYLKPHQRGVGWGRCHAVRDLGLLRIAAMKVLAPDSGGATARGPAVHPRGRRSRRSSITRTSRRCTRSASTGRGTATSPMKRIEGDTLGDWSTRAGRQSGFSRGAERDDGGVPQGLRGARLRAQPRRPPLRHQTGKHPGRPVRTGLPGRLGAGDRGSGACHAQRDADPGGRRRREPRRGGVGRAERPRSCRPSRRWERGIASTSGPISSAWAPSSTTS